MKRSQINAIIEANMGFIAEMNFKLPPFAFWNRDDWKTKNHEYDEPVLFPQCYEYPKWEVE
jgi:D-lyxose ketol-isomerase